MKGIFALLGILMAGGVFFYYTKSEYDNTAAVRAEIEQYQVALTRNVKTNRWNFWQCMELFERSFNIAHSSHAIFSQGDIKNRPFSFSL